MTNSPNYMVQFVGFKTILKETDFLRRWTPFASNFKSQGISTIDLYHVISNDDLAYLSLNIWEEKTYFKTFPTGIANSGSGGGISAVQLGGYHLNPENFEKLDNIKLLFFKNIIKVNGKDIISCINPSNSGLFKQAVILNEDKINIGFSFPSMSIKCKYLLSI